VPGCHGAEGENRSHEIDNEMQTKVSNSDDTAVNYAQPGPYEVKTKEYLWLKRDGRSVPVKVHYPRAEGRFPLAIFSHGGGGNWDSNILQAKHLASHGYIVACPVHVYSNLSRVLYYMSKPGGNLKFWWAVHRITLDPRAALGRPKDIQFVIDKCSEWNRSDFDLKNKINTDKITVIGHSYGAYTTLVICGARPVGTHLNPRVEPHDSRLKNLSDDRVTIGIAMSPQGADSTWFDRNSFKSINKPIMFISGSKDQQKSASGDVMPSSKRMEAFNFSPPGNKYMLWLKNADHMGFSHNPELPNKAIPSTSLEDSQRISKAMMLVFCNAYLKGNKQAADHLNKKYANSLIGGVVSSIDWFQK
jgi:predicted dienelactone hydrolase